ncbi:MAG: hypothetical protein WBM48_13310 [Polyangiales bacterium]
MDFRVVDTSGTYPDIECDLDLFASGVLSLSLNGCIQDPSALIVEVMCAIAHGGGGACVMKKQQILWSIILGSMLAATGCGDDGTSGTDGTEKGSCETICDSPCQLFERADSTSPTCLADCADAGYDGCESETRALVSCAERAQAGDCSVDPNPACGAESDAWSDCP